MTLKTKVAFPLALAAGLVALLATASAAIASHPTPANGGAKSITFSTVPAFRQCAAPGNSTHGAPLGAPSCTPPRQTSRNLTIGRKASSRLTITVICTNGQPPSPTCGAPGDQADVRLTATSTDVRCKAGVQAARCPNENGAPAGVVGNDYTGEVEGTANIRITDTFNGAPSFTTHATVLDLPFPVDARCTGTAGDATIGGRCNVTTSADATVPNVTKENKKAIVEIGQIEIIDGGSDGDVDTPGPAARPNERFAVQGIFIP